MYCTTELFVIIVVVFLVQALFMVIIFRLFFTIIPMRGSQSFWIFLCFVYPVN